MTCQSYLVVSISIYLRSNEDSGLIICLKIYFFKEIFIYFANVLYFIYLLICDKHTLSGIMCHSNTDDEAIFYMVN